MEVDDACESSGADCGFGTVKDLITINPWIQKRKEEFSKKEVERIVDRLKGHVTK